MRKSPSCSTNQKTRTNTQEISWKHLPYTKFAATSLQLNTGAPVWHLFQAMTLMLFFPQARGKRVAFLHPCWQMVIRSSRAERDSYQVLRGMGSLQGQPGPWLGADPEGERGRGDAQGAFDPALVRERPPSSRAIFLMPAAWAFLHRQVFTALPFPCPSTSKCPSSFI